MLRKVLSGFAFSCIKKPNEDEEADLQARGNEKETFFEKVETHQKRPKSSEINIPVSSALARDKNPDTASWMDFHPKANQSRKRYKYRQRLEAIELSQLTRQDVMDLDAGFHIDANDLKNDQDTLPFQPQDEETKMAQTSGQSISSGSTEEVMLNPGNFSSSDVTSCEQDKIDLPQNSMIQIGSIVESGDASLPPTVVGKKQTEQVIFRSNDVEGMMLR